MKTEITPRFSIILPNKLAYKLESDLLQCNQNNIMEDISMNEFIKQITAYTYIGDFGQTVYEFAMECTGNIPPVSAGDFKISGAQKDISGKVPPSDIIGIRKENNVIVIEADPFLYRTDFAVTGSGDAEKLSFSKGDITHMVTRTADDFAAHNEGGVLYRLYSPEVSGPRPLVLFLHGGGETGNDNFSQMVGTIGAASLAERWPDSYIMAPQAPGKQMTPEEFQEIMKTANPFDMINDKFPYSGKCTSGWNRDYLSKVCRIIRDMISDGRVDERRVYVIGLSMGGAGTLRALSVDPELFAAAAPICPSMNNETYNILNNIRNNALWISAAYIDHQPSRHAYLTRAYQKLLAEGKTEVNLTIYTPEELAKYGIGCRSDLTYTELLSENHNCWTLTLHNEHGILDWLISVIKRLD